MDGLVQGEFRLRHILSTRVLPQAPEGDLHLPQVQHLILSEISEFPSLSHGEGTAEPAFSPHPYAFGTVPIAPEGGDAAGAHIEIASVVLLLLGAQSFSEHLGDFVVGVGIVCFRQFEVVNAVVLHFRMRQPLHERLRHRFQQVDVSEVVQKTTIQLVQVALALGQGQAAQLVKAQQAVPVQTRLQSSEQGLPFGQ